MVQAASNGHIETDALAMQEMMESWDDLGDVDISKVDLSMPPSFEHRLWANRRMMLVRDANVVRLDIVGNKIANPQRADEATRQYNAILWQIAAIDRRFPKVKAESMELMALIAAEEADSQRKRQDALNGKK